MNEELTLAIGGKVVVAVEVALAEHDTSPDEFSVVVRRYSGQEPPEGRATWHVLENDEGFSLQITTQTVSTGICLAGCFAGLIPPTSDLNKCLKKAKNRKAVRTCLWGQGVTMVISGLSCIYGCLQIP